MVDALIVFFCILPWVALIVTMLLHERRREKEARHDFTTEDDHD